MTRIVKTLSTGTAALFVLWALAAAPAMARGGHMKDGFDGGLFRMEHMASKLELTESQRADFERIMDASREAARPHVQTLIELRKEKRRLKDAESFDEAAIRSLAAKKSAAMTEMAVIRARKRFEFRSILTAEQREKLGSRHGRGDYHH